VSRRRHIWTLPILLLVLASLAACAEQEGNVSEVITPSLTATPSHTASPSPSPTASASPSPSGSPPAALVARGSALYASLGCQSCHSTDGSQGVGPTFKGLFGSQVSLTGGQSVTADAAYLSKSIEDPDAQIVSGYTAGVMSGVVKPGAVSASDVAALVAYIESLR
jgi:cytochrome c oxidase subunit II